MSQTHRGFESATLIHAVQDVTERGFNIKTHVYGKAQFKSDFKLFTPLPPPNVMSADYHKL